MNDTERARWLPTPRRATRACLRLVCIPYAGGGATVFRAWSEGLPPTVEVRPVQLPGRQDRQRETPLVRVEAIVDALVDALTPLPPLPTAVFGHSFGGLIAYEVARRLQADGAPPVALVVGGRNAPHVPSRGQEIHALPDDDFFSALNRRYGTPSSVLRDPDLRALVVPPLRADFEAHETYVHQPSNPLTVPVTALHGRQDATMSRADADAWRETTSGPASVHEVDAGHFFVDTHRLWVLEQVARAVGAALG